MLAALAAKGCRVRMKGPDKGVAQCPVHPDRHPSLCVDRKGSVVLLKCFGGCTNDAIRHALGLQWSDLRDGPSPPRGPRHRKAEHVYRDPSGEPYAQKVRFEPKDFRWERPDKTAPSGWLSGLNGLKPSLYGLENIVEERRVLLVEGEKAVDHLREKGVLAVCPPSGASTWRDGWTQQLWGCGVNEVLILPDADPEGRRHARRVAESCYRFRPVVVQEPDREVGTVAAEGNPDGGPLSVQIVELHGLLHGEDVVDWLTTHGHSIANLLSATAAATRWEPVDPVEHRRALGRMRARRHRIRQGLVHSDDVTLQRPVRTGTDMYLLHRDQISIRVTRDAVNSNKTVNRSQLQVLRACADAQGVVTVADLVAQHGSAKRAAQASISRTLQRLQRRGLVERLNTAGRVIEGGGRAVAARLTPAGHAAAMNALDHAATRLEVVRVA